jgi:hypothetical protein
MTLITAALTLLSQPEPDSGYVSKYSPGVFERAIGVRIENGYGHVPADWQSYDGYWAGLDCAAALEGVTLYARPGAGYPWERLLYADCSGHQTTTDHFLRDGILGELDWATFERWHAAGYHSEKGMPVELRPVEAFYEWLG